MRDFILHHLHYVSAGVLFAVVGFVTADFVTTVAAFFFALFIGKLLEAK